jgi:hypothetical protein
MADQENNSVLGQQAQGDAGKKDADATTQANFTQGAEAQGAQAQGQTEQNAPMGVGQGSFQGAGDLGAQQSFAQQGEVDQQRMGATSDQLGQNRQGYGGSTKQDTSGGMGTQQAIQGAQGQTGVLGPQPGQAQGQPASPTTGGPSLAQGLTDNNSR